MKNDFGELRSALSDTPTEESWERLCASIDAWDTDAFDEEALLYVTRELEDWPDELRVAPDSWRALAVSPDLPRKLGLALHYPGVEIDDATLARWLDSGVMHDVRDFDLKMVEGAELITRFAKEGAFVSVRKLELDKIDLEVLRALTESPSLRDIEWLHIGWAGLSGDEVGVLVGAAPWRNLEYLNIEGNGIKEQGGVALVSSPHLASLERLRLGWNDVGNATCEALAHEAVFTSRLVELGLENNSIDDRGGVALCSSSRLSGLVEFDLYNNSLTARVARAIAQNPALAGVTTMDLNANIIGDEGREALRGSPFLSAEVLERVERFQDDEIKLAYDEEL